MKRQRYLDVMEYTPKENGEFIERVSKRGLTLDKGAVLLFLFYFKRQNMAFSNFYQTVCICL